MLGVHCSCTCFSSFSLYSVYIIAPFLFSLKTLENQRFPDLFRRYKNGTLAKYGFSPLWKTFFSPRNRPVDLVLDLEILKRLRKFLTSMNIQLHAKTQFHTSLMGCKFGLARFWATSLITKVSLGVEFAMENPELSEYSF